MKVVFFTLALLASFTHTHMTDFDERRIRPVSLTRGAL